MTKLIRMKKKNNRGFSLVEVMLAICILGLVAAPLLQIIYSSYAMNIKSRKYLAAADLLQTVMEGISAQTWEDSTPFVYEKEAESEDGESEDGESADGESVDGESADGESADGESADGESADSSQKVVICGLDTYYHKTLTSGDMDNKSAIFSTHGIGDSVNIPEGYYIKHPVTNPVNAHSLEPLEFKEVDYNGYTFDVYIYVDVTGLNNNKKKGENYYTAPLKVKIFDEDGNEIASASTSVISERTKH